MSTFCRVVRSLGETKLSAVPAWAASTLTPQTAKAIATETLYVYRL